MKKLFLSLAICLGLWSQSYALTGTLTAIDSTYSTLTFKLATSSESPDSVIAYYLVVNEVYTKSITSSLTDPDTFDAVTGLEDGTSYLAYAVIHAYDTTGSTLVPKYYSTDTVRAVTKNRGITLASISVTYRSFGVHITANNPDSAFKKMLLQISSYGSSSWTLVSGDSSDLDGNDTLSTYSAPTDLTPGSVYQARVIVYDSTGVDTSATLDIVTSSIPNYSNSYIISDGWTYPGQFHWKTSWNKGYSTFRSPQFPINTYKTLNIQCRVMGIDNNQVDSLSLLTLYLYTDRNGSTAKIDSLIVKKPDTATVNTAWYYFQPFAGVDSTYIKAKNWGGTVWIEGIRQDSTGTANTDTTTRDTQYLDSWFNFKE